MLKSRALRWLVCALLALLLLWALAWLAVPPLLKWQLETRGSQLLGRELRVAEVRFSPTTLALTLRELSVGAAPGSPGPRRNCRSSVCSWTSTRARCCAWRR